MSCPAAPGGDDTLKGKNGDDQLLDEAGEDRLQGGRGDDALFGGADNDLLIGGRDDDTLTGGEGGDRFVFRGRCDDDVITDLTFADGDEIKISGQRLINSEADLISFTERLNENNEQSTLATIEGDDLRLDTGQSEILIENVVSDWAEGLLLA